MRFASARPDADPGASRVLLVTPKCLRNMAKTIKSNSKSSDNAPERTFAARLRRLMAEAGFDSQTCFSKKTGIDRTRINRLLNEHGKPLADEIAIFAQALGVSQDQLLAGVEVPRAIAKSSERHRELLRRALDAEREREEALAKAGALQTEIERQASDHASARQNDRAVIARVEEDKRRLQAELWQAKARFLAAEAQLDATRRRAVLLEGSLARAGAGSSGGETVEDVQRVVCHYFKLRVTDLLSTDRYKSVAFARHVAMYLCVQRMKLHLFEVGRAFGNRHHTTVRSAVRKIELERAESAEVRADIKAIERKLGPAPAPKNSSVPP